MDVRYPKAVHAGFEEIHTRLGGVDVLVNNGGIGMRTVNPRFLTEPQPFWAVSPERFRDVVETKLTGSFPVAQASVPSQGSYDFSHLNLCSSNLGHHMAVGDPA